MVSRLAEKSSRVCAPLQNKKHVLSVMARLQCTRTKVSAQCNDGYCAVSRYVSKTLTCMEEITGVALVSKSFSVKRIRTKARRMSARGANLNHHRVAFAFVS